MHRRARPRRRLPAAGGVDLPPADRARQLPRRAGDPEGAGPQGRAEARADGSSLAEFGLAHVAERLGETLSGGERRRAEIARSLIPAPASSSSTSPSPASTPSTCASFQKEIAPLKARGLGVLITDHNVQDTLGICDRAYIIAQGQILEEGTPRRSAWSERAPSTWRAFRRQRREQMPFGHRLASAEKKVRRSNTSLDFRWPTLCVELLTASGSPETSPNSMISLGGNWRMQAGGHRSRGLRRMEGVLLVWHGP